MSAEYIYPSNNGFTVYSKSGCSNCVHVKQILKDKKVPVVVVECDDYLYENKHFFLNFMNEQADKVCTTFPMVFYDGKYIGGFKDTVQLLDILLTFDDFF